MPTELKMKHLYRAKRFREEESQLKPPLPQWAGDWALLLFFPGQLLFLELALRLVMGHDPRFAAIAGVFALSFGALLAGIFGFFSGKGRRIGQLVLSFLLSGIYIAEVIARRILQTYYPFSILGTAADNRVTDYSQLIFVAILRSLPVIALFLLPPVLLILLTNGKPLPTADTRRALAALGAFLLLHGAALGLVHLGVWNNLDLNPAVLYRSDTAPDDQVDRLGLVTMLRLDLKYKLFPLSASSGEFVAVALPDEEEEDEAPPVETPAPSPSPSPEAVAQGAPDNEKEPEPTPTPEPVDRSPQVLNVNLEKMAAESQNSDVTWLAEYFASLKPTNKNEYTGLFEGCNVIFLTLEGFSGYAISEQYTPTLYRLQHEGFYFKNYYTALHYTSTSNGECQHLLGLYPKNGNPISMSRTGETGFHAVFSLAQQLGKQGYANLGYHNNGDMYNRQKSHENLGYDWKYLGHGLPAETGSGGDWLWPQRDSYLAEITLPEITSQESPVNVYYITITGHTPYSFNWAVKDYRVQLESAPYSEKTKAYLATCMEVDKMFSVLLEGLEEAGMLENTVICASGDHVPYADIEVLEELAGKPFGSSAAMTNIDESSIDFEVYRSAAILWAGSMQAPVEIGKVTCQVDLLPTLSNLLGLDYDSRMLHGSDALSDSEGLVVFSSRSWLSDRGFYNRFTQTFTPSPSAAFRSDKDRGAYVEAMKTLVGYKLDSTGKIIESDFYEKMMQYLN